MLHYPIGSSGQILILTDEVLQHFSRYRQRLPHQKEAGGQLFARFSANEIHIVEATGPRKTDRRGRTFYHPDRQQEQAEIDARYELGLHYVGDWHTHPTKYPLASYTDVSNIRDSVTRSRHQLNAFVLVIVGTTKPPAGLYVSINDGVVSQRLEMT
jgi:integrative and conjugative element protein (TIGR02256 family)